MKYCLYCEIYTYDSHFVRFRGKEICLIERDEILKSEAYMDATTDEFDYGD